VGQISQAIDRPGGLTGVVNPQAATGGADPDGPDDARNSVPIHVQTLDRVVSLDDYENYARAFAGVAKASTSWAWFGHTRGVAVTVCGAGGSTLDPNGATIVNLAAALTGAGNPYVPLKVMPHRQALFSVGGVVRIDADRETGQVMDNVRAALRDAFSFAARKLGQAVAQSEVVAAIQEVPGVVAVKLTRFSLNETALAVRTFMPVDADLIHSLRPLRLSGPPAEFLSASAPPSGRAPATPASLLLIDPASLDGLGVWL
jgi:predicted phage baseplate assembly protein